MNKFKHYLKRKFYNWNNACPKCGCVDYDTITTDSLDYLVTEFKEVCTKCGQEVGYWAYGHYTYPRTKTEELRFMLSYYKSKIISKIKFK